MRGPRPTEGRVNWNYRSDGGSTSSYGRSGYMDLPPNVNHSITYSNPNPNPKTLTQALKHLNPNTNTNPNCYGDGEIVLVLSD